MAVNQDKLNLLTDALTILRKMKLQESNCRILVESLYSEAIIAGTQEDYLNLALYLLEMVHGSVKGVIEDSTFDFELDKIGDVECYSSGDLKNYFNDEADVYPVSLYVVAKEEDISKINKHLKFH